MQARRVLEKQDLGPDLFLLSLERGDLVFTPGDCVDLFGPDGVVSRPYSIASGTNEAQLRFLIRRVDAGRVSPWLATRRPGDRVRLSPPFGWFRPGSTARWSFAATGTGIAPCLSALRSGLPAPQQVFHGVRQRSDLAGLAELAAATELHPAVSRGPHEPHPAGRITGLLDRMRLEPDLHVYLCGLDAMIDEVARVLENRGHPSNQIHRECFFHAPS